MHILEMRGGGFLYQHRPDLMPFDYLSNEEVAMWAAHYEAEQLRRPRK